MTQSVVSAANEKTRRYDLDWLRVLAVLLLVPFHTALIFSLNRRDVVYIKDTVESPFLVSIDGFIYLWHMPLLFVIAGAATWFALGGRTSGEYLLERVTRLLVPALFAFATLIPLMLGVHYLGKPDAPPLGEIYRRYFTLNPNDLSGLNGNFTPAHLWFILFLALFSVVALPLFNYLKRASSQPVIDRLVRLVISTDIVFVPGFLLYLLSRLPSLSDKNPFFFLALFIFGFILVADVRFQQLLDQRAVGILLISVFMTVVLYALESNYIRTPLVTWAYGMVYNLCRWSWCLAFIGLGHRFLNARSRFLSYCTEAAFPFYVLHLPVDTIVGYFVIQMSASIAVKYCIIIIVTIVLTLAIYEGLVKRTALTRFLFGMKPLPPRPSHPVQTPKTKTA